MVARPNLLVFRKHPYQEDPNEDVLSTYNTYYKPSNSLIYLAGDIDLGATMAKMDGVFKDFSDKRPEIDFEQTPVKPQNPFIRTTTETYSGMPGTSCGSNPETAEFAAGYPERGDKRSIDITRDYKQGIIPHFLQRDKRWGYDSYGDSMISHRPDTLLL